MYVFINISFISNILWIIIIDCFFYCRYEAVSDSDLLQYYIPLLKLCIELYMNANKDRTHLEQRLANFKLRGMKVDGLPFIDIILKDVLPK